MSAPTKNLIQALVLKVEFLLAEEIPAELGPTATPNSLRRQYYKTKKMIEEIQQVTKRVEETSDSARDDIGKTAAAHREAKEAAYAEWVNNLQVNTKLQALLTKLRLWIDRRENLEERLDIENPEESSVSSSSDAPVRRMNRPQIKLRTFNGAVESWLPFWDTFRSLVHEDSAVSKIEKFNLLEANLEDSASALIEGIPLTEDGYDTAVDLLLKKFGDDNKLIRNLNQELISLPISSSFEEDEALHLRIEKICRQLVSLNQDVNSAPYFMTLEGKLSAPILDKYFCIKDAEDRNDWNTEKFRDAFERALTQIRNRKEAKSGGLTQNFEPKSEPTMNFAVKFDPQIRDRERSPSPRSFQGRNAQANYPSSSRNSERNSRDSRDRDSRYENRSRWRSPSPNPRRSAGSSPDRSFSPRRFPCQFCDELHSPTSCPNYKTALERRNRTFKKELCLYCLKKGHFASQCKAEKRKCYFCGLTSHHPALCRQKFEHRNSSPRSRENSSPTRNKPGVSASNNEVETIQSESSGNCVELKCEQTRKVNFAENERIIASSCIADPNSKISILKIIPAKIYNPIHPERYRTELVFLDDGSQKSYIEENLAKELRLDVLGSKKFSLYGLGQAKIGEFEKPLVEFGVKAKRFDMLIKGRTLNTILGEMPIFIANDIPKEELQKNKLSARLVIGKPKVIIGNDFYNFLGVRPLQQFPSGIWVSHTNLGNVLNGQGKVRYLGENNAKIREISSSSMELESDSAEMEESLFDLVKKQDSLQSIGLEDSLVKDHEIKEEMERKISFNGTHYQTKLLWNEELAAKLPTNYDMAFCQLRSNLERLRKRPELLKIYNDTILEQLEKGLIERVEPLEDKYKIGQKAHYLPHHSIERSDKEHTKVRIVYNASAKRGKAPSLNMCLEKGPNLLNNLCGIVLRARLEKILIICDIAKAFHQVFLDPDDRNAMRFLWVLNPFEENSEVIEYRFTRVTFGVICSPTHLALAIEMHLRKFEGEFVRKIARDAYVDNLLAGVSSPEEVKWAYDEIKRIFAEGGMNVREFVSNCVEEIRKLPPEDRIDKIETKLLGICWNVEKDEFHFRLPTFKADRKITRLTILSQIATPFDLIGFLAPVILQAKLFRQKVESDKRLSWNSELPKEQQEEWSKLMDTWKGAEFTIPRLINLADQKGKSFEIHGFADASNSAFGAAIYLRIITANEISVHLIFAKSLVVPSTMPKTKRTTPMLELHAAMLCCKYMNFVREELEKEIKIAKMLMHSDSTDVLDFLRSDKKFDRFTKNRLNKIREFKVRHIEGKNNPADLASRGVTPEELKKANFWWFGPSFLSKSDDQWPVTVREFDPSASNESKKCEFSLAVRSVQKTPFCVDVARFSVWHRLSHTLAYVLRVFKEKTRERAASGKLGKEKIAELIHACRPLGVNEVDKAEILLCKFAQQEFPPSKDSLANLRLFKDDEIWRSAGRIDNSGLDYQTLNPIFISHKAHIALLLVRKAHLDTLHGGQSAVCAHLRKKYWITHSRRLIYNVLQRNAKTKCGLCARLLAKPFPYPKAPSLPEFRVKGNSAWEFIGIDFFGYMNVRGLAETQKCWGVIFTCCLTRAVHLEIVTDMSAEKFLLAFVRFIRRRRCPKLIASDNGSAFKLANKAIQALVNEEIEQKKQWLDICQSEKIEEFSLKNGITWHFITPNSPFMGGFWERLIYSIKIPLYRTVRKKAIYFEELQTLFVEIENIVNGRPLTYSSESDTILPISPSDIINPSIGPVFELCPAVEEDEEYLPIRTTRESLLEAHKKVILRTHKFFARWKEEYLVSLREYHKTKAKIGENFPRENQVVIVKSDNDNCPRNLWSLGRITKILSKRTVKVKIGKKEFDRPICNLFPLEIEDSLELEPKNIVPNELGLAQQNNQNEKIFSALTLEFPIPAGTMYNRYGRGGRGGHGGGRGYQPRFAPIQRPQQQQQNAPVRGRGGLNFANNDDWNNANALEAAEARSPVLILTDSEPMELRELVRQHELRVMVFEPQNWSAETIGRELTISPAVQTIVLWRINVDFGTIELAQKIHRIFGTSRRCIWVTDNAQRNCNYFTFMSEPSNSEELMAGLENLGIEFVGRQFNAQAQAQRQEERERESRERVFVPSRQFFQRGYYRGRGRGGGPIRGRRGRGSNFFQVRVDPDRDQQQNNREQVRIDPERGRHPQQQNEQLEANPVRGQGFEGPNHIPIKRFKGADIPAEVKEVRPVMVDQGTSFDEADLAVAGQGGSAQNNNAAKDDDKVIQLISKQDGEESVELNEEVAKKLFDDDKMDSEDQGDAGQLSNSGKQSSSQGSANNSKQNVGIGPSNLANKLAGLNVLLMTICWLCSPSLAIPMICHHRTDPKFVRLEYDQSQCFTASNFIGQPVSWLQIDLFKPMSEPFVFFGSKCVKISQKVRYRTDVLGYKYEERPDQIILPISKEECAKMIKYKTCEFGNLVQFDEGQEHTNNPLQIVQSYFNVGWQFAVANNCFLANITLVGRPGEEKIRSTTENVEKCLYSDEFCPLENGGLIAWNFSNKKEDAKKLCLYRKMGRFNGTFSKNVWLANDKERALVFDQNSRTVESCGKDLKVSFSGFAITSDHFEIIVNGPSPPISGGKLRRGKRKVDSDENIKATEFLAHLQAESAYQNEALKKAIEFICTIISQQQDNSKFSNHNPTFLMREKMETEFLEAMWVGPQVLAYWPCSPINVTFVSTNGFCHKDVPVNITLEGKTFFVGYLETLTGIIRENSPKIECSSVQFQYISMSDKILKINQITGETKELDDIEVKHIGMKTLEGKLPTFELQVFRKQNLFNLSDNHIDLLEIMEAFKSARLIDPRQSGDKKNWVTSYTSSETIDWSKLFGNFDWTKILFRLIVIALLIKALVEFYLWYQKRIVRRELKSLINSTEQFIPQAKQPDVSQAVFTHQPKCSHQPVSPLPVVTFQAGSVPSRDETEVEDEEKPMRKEKKKRKKHRIPK